jgi:hypothetical protein
MCERVVARECDVASTEATEATEQRRVSATVTSFSELCRLLQRDHPTHRLFALFPTDSNQL